jgi:acetyl esterase/lipase
MSWRRAGLAAVCVCVLAACGGGKKATLAASATIDADAPTTTAAPGPYAVRKGVVYGEAAVDAPAPATVPLLLDMYEPEAAEADPRPVVVLIHGGGLSVQSRDDAGTVRIAQALAGRGIVAVSIDYRLDDQQPVASPRVAPLADALSGSSVGNAMLAAVDDTLTAIDYLRANAYNLRIDTSRIGLVGSSAGAITADHVAYVLDNHGIAHVPIRFVASLWGGIFAAPPAGTDEPAVDQVDPGEPALFAVHGDVDTTVPVASSDQLVDRARAVGVPVEYHRIVGGAHGYDGSQFFTQPVDGTQTSVDRLQAFAVEQLRPT